MVSLVLMAGFLGVMQPSQAHLVQNVMIAHGTKASRCHSGAQAYHCHSSGKGASNEPLGAVSAPLHPIGNLNCTDFKHKGDVIAFNAFYKKTGVDDPHDLDRDSDGMACETKPKR